MVVSVTGDRPLCRVGDIGIWVSPGVEVTFSFLKVTFRNVKVTIRVVKIPFSGMIMALIQVVKGECYGATRVRNLVPGPDPEIKKLSVGA